MLRRGAHIHEGLGGQSKQVGSGRFTAYKLKVSVLVQQPGDRLLAVLPDVICVAKALAMSPEEPSFN